ncbi:MAG: EamA family transporter, partial [Ignavibacteriaceae bacterium]|nr:EamA family transporter [Ignavibacteriaceae bacterium]
MHWFFFAITSAVLSSVAAITQKKALVKMNALEFSFHLSWLNLLFCLPFLFDPGFGEINSHQALIMFIKTMLQALAFWCVMLSLKNLEISSALPLLALTPGFVAIFAFVFIGEKLTTTQTLGLTMLLFGSYFIEMKSIKNAIEPFRVFFKTKKYIYVAAALAFFTVSTILDKYLLKDQKMETSSFMVLQHFFFLVDFFILMLITKSSFSLPKKPDFKYVALLVLLTAFITIGYRYTQIIAFTLAPV